MQASKLYYLQRLQNTRKLETGGRKGNEIPNGNQKKVIWVEVSKVAGWCEDVYLAESAAHQTMRGLFSEP